MRRALIVIPWLRTMSACATAQAVILGVLEDVPPIHAGEADRPAVRVLFKSDGLNWSAYPSDCPDEDCLRKIASEYPPTITWSVGFRGRNRFALTSHAPATFDFYSHAGLESLEKPSQVSWIGQKSERFGGFTGEAVYRPLVAISRPYLSDPDGWSKSTPPDMVLHELRTAFRRENPKLCRRSQTDETKGTSFDYQDSQIPVADALVSRHGSWIAELHLDDASACDDVVEFDDPWFVVKPDGSTQYLGEGIWLVDTGDFNHDGKSEILFSIASYNRGGYELFYDDFAKHVSFEYSFH